MTAATINTRMTYEGKDYWAVMATANHTVLGREDHGIFRFGVDVDLLGEGSVQLGWLEPNIRHVQYFIMAIAGDYGSWEQIPGKRFFALYEPDERHRDMSYCKGIASLDGTRVFLFESVRQG